MALPNHHGLVIIDTTISSTDGGSTAGWVKILSDSSHRKGYNLYIDPEHETAEDIILIGTSDPETTIPAPADGTNISQIAYLTVGGTPFASSNETTAIKNDIWIKSSGTSVPLLGYVLDGSAYL